MPDPDDLTDRFRDDVSDIPSSLSVAALVRNMIKHVIVTPELLDSYRRIAGLVFFFLAGTGEEVLVDVRRTAV